MRAPSASSKRNFSVPSAAGVRETTFGTPMAKRVASASRIAFGRFVISANDGAPLVDPLRDLRGAKRLRRDVADRAREVEGREAEKVLHGRLWTDAAPDGVPAQPLRATVERRVTVAAGGAARGSGASDRCRPTAGSPRSLTLIWNDGRFASGRRSPSPRRLRRRAGSTGSAPTSGARACRAQPSRRGRGRRRTPRPSPSRGSRALSPSDDTDSFSAAPSSRRYARTFSSRAIWAAI